LDRAGCLGHFGPKPCNPLAASGVRFIVDTSSCSKIASVATRSTRSNPTCPRSSLTQGSKGLRVSWCTRGRSTSLAIVLGPNLFFCRPSTAGPGPLHLAPPHHHVPSGGPAQPKGDLGHRVCTQKLGRAGIKAAFDVCYVLSRGAKAAIAGDPSRARNRHGPAPKVRLYKRNARER
jgi:hypothetical protein